MFGYKNEYFKKNTLFMLFKTCVFLQLTYQPPYALNKIHSNASTDSTCFGIGMPSSGSYLEERSTPRPSRYVIALAGMIKILKYQNYKTDEVNKHIITML
jgi:hypothetical protein